jgi:hypothetical protein
VKFDHRDPLISGDGKPVVRWRKDEQGERTGNGPVPLEPEKFVRIAGDDIRVVPAE